MSRRLPGSVGENGRRNILRSKLKKFTQRLPSASPALNEEAKPTLRSRALADAINGANRLDGVVSALKLVNGPDKHQSLEAKQRLRKKKKGTAPSIKQPTVSILC